MLGSDGIVRGAEVRLRADTIATNDAFSTRRRRIALPLQGRGRGEGESRNGVRTLAHPGGAFGGFAGGTGTLAGCLLLDHPFRIVVRDEVAAPLRLAQDAVALHQLRKAGDQRFGVLAIPWRNNQHE